jgi:nucleoside-diphosphate-sugar epimerase
VIAVVTGGTGFLGRRLVHQLLESGAEVRCLVRASSDRSALQHGLSDERAARLSTFTGSLERPESFRSALVGGTVLFHVAAALKGSVPALFLSNVVGTRHLIENANRANVHRLVLVSSLAVHGVGHLKRGSVVDETCPLDPEPHRRDPYTFSKVEQERVAWEAHERSAIRLSVVRPGVIYGPGRDCLSGRIGIRLGGFLLKMGGRQRLPYTFVDNCATAVRLAGTVAAAEGESFNVVDDAPPTGNELLRRYRRSGNRVRVFGLPQWSIGPLSRLCQWYHRWSRGQLPDVLTPYKSAAMWKPLRYSNAKARSVLGWEPVVGFEQGLRETLDRVHATALT